jgi:hypothetical protein
MYKLGFGTESIYIQDGEEIVKGEKLREIVASLVNGEYKVSKEELLEKVPTGKEKNKVVKVVNFYIVEK